MAADIRSAPITRWRGTSCTTIPRPSSTPFTWDKDRQIGTDSKRFRSAYASTYAPQTGFTIYMGAQLRF